MMSAEDAYKAGIDDFNRAVLTTEHLTGAEREKAIRKVLIQAWEDHVMAGELPPPV